MTDIIGELQERDPAASLRVRLTTEDLGPAVPMAGSLGEAIVTEGQVVTYVGRADLQSGMIAAAIEKASQTVETFAAASDRLSALGDDINAQLEELSATVGRPVAEVAPEVKKWARQTLTVTEELAAKIARVEEAAEKTVGLAAVLAAMINDLGFISCGGAMSMEQQDEVALGAVTPSLQIADSVSGKIMTLSSVVQGAIETLGCAGQALGITNELTRRTEHLANKFDALLIHSNAR